jgi:tetratricopeptide (TPR) repeat protein
MTLKTWIKSSEENKLIGKFLRDESCRMITVVGRAGIGKTAMVCRLLKSLENAGHVETQDFASLPVDGIVYLSAVGTRIVNVPNLFADLCQLVPDDAARDLDALYKNPQVSTEAKINTLLAEFPSGQFIVLLDNFENVLDAETMNIRDAELNEALRALLNAPHHAVKVIITTRIAPHDLGFVHPGRQNRLNLDNGLEPQYAKNVLTENDADGTLGLKNAPDDLLTRACEFTRGFPRALEALIAILRADRYTTLAEILGVEAQHIAPLPAPLQNNIVEALVGEAFNRLDPNAQRVMQALAVYNRPVTPAAVDYLLQPFAASVNSAPVLNRLVTMQFVRRESGRYYLHPTDRAYAFGRLPRTPAPLPPLNAEEQGRTGAEENTFTQHDLTTHAADYFAQTRKPREAWKTLADLEPQLNEFDLRCAAEDYDTAASVLLEIDFNYLLLWGHYRLMIELHEKLQGKIGDKFSQLRSLHNMSSSLYSTSQVQKAIALYEQCLPIARELKNKQAEGAILGNLGNAYSNLGETRRAITFHEQALAIAREIGDKQDEGGHLGNLGAIYSNLGETRNAIQFYEQALTIQRETGDKLGEGIDLGNISECLIDLGQYSKSIEHSQKNTEISNEIGDTARSSYGYGWIALAHLYTGNLPAARAAAETAHKYDVPHNNHNVAALLGIITLRQNDVTAAQEAFTAAIQHADKILGQTPELYDALDAKGIALCGLALGEDNGQERINRTNQATAIFQQARKINKDKGIVNRVLRLIDALALAHPDGNAILAEARKAASGE